MVAAGATVLMAASEESSSNGTENSSRHYENQTGSSQCNEVQCSQQSIECSTKRNLMPCTSNTKEKNRSHMLDKTSRPTSRVESKEGSKTVTLHKTTPIRETKASRLRAASIISPSGGTSISRRIGVSESSSPWSLQPGTSLSFREHKCAQESPISSDSSSTMNPTRERDKSYKRKSYLNRSLNSEVAAPDRSNQSEYSERRSRRQSSKQGHISETISTSDSGAHRQTATNLQRKHLESKVTSQRVSAQYNTNRSRTHTSPSVACPVSTKYSNAQRTSNHGPSDSEVSRRVDALTALTRATMERVERLTSQANLLLANDEQRSEANSTSESSTDNCEYSPDNPTNAAHEVPASPSKCSILKKSNDEYSQESNATRSPHAPVSILKHKLPDNETGQSSSNSSHATLPVTFSPSVVEPAHKRHGILKKRSSLDESEILRRRSCSPDVSFTDNSYSEFRPILKNQRRSSLDEIIKRDQSPDPQPTSILKRKSSREDDREDRQLGSPEPQGILKRKSANASRINNTFHHVTIATDMMAVAGGNDTLESSEVRPILKKKHSREESSGNDPPSHEPRPILKKKSSTESDEHDDRPKKTILKCSRKSSQEDCDYETELTSPKKLSMLRNRVLQSRGAGLLDGDNVRPILKQVAARDNESRVRLNLRDNASSFDDDYTDPEDLFHRKRAQSVGHVQPSSGSNELTAVLGKRRSLESTSLIDMLQERMQPRAASTNGGCSRAAILETDKGPSTSSYETTTSATAEGEFACKANNKDKPTIPMFEAQEESNVDSHIFSINSNTDKDTRHSAQMTDSKKIDTKVCIDKMQEQVDMCDAQESYAVHRSNSVSKMALHFKTLQEKAQSAKDKDAAAQRTPKKGSHGIQRYRERKVQGSDRFNTQPVTFQEVQEAVLQNQRSASRTDGLPDADSTGAEDEFDPSKLSLAERVRLFNQKIATEGTSGSLGGSQERHARRRPSTRYKTQPITSEEVEVASRISPFSGSVHLPSTLGRTDESRGSTDARLPFTSQNELLKGILKSSNSHTHDALRSKSPELEGLKLIKSVLKRESEELQQQQQQEQQQQQQQQQTTTTENCDIFPRSILKTNSLAKSQEINSSHDNREEADGAANVQSRNANVETSHRDTTEDGTGESDDIVQRNSHCAYGGSEGSNEADDEQNETKQRYTVPFYKSIISQDQSCKLRTNVALDSVDNVLPESVVYRKRNREAKCSSVDDTVRASDDETSSSGGREVRSIIKNEAIHRRRQAILAKQARSAALAKSASHHALSSETRSVQEQHAVPLPGLCRSATQTMPVAESNEGPAMSIADRLAALQRSGNTNWKRRVVSESSNISETINISKDELAIKQGVLADCLGKLESATEGWKKRITAPDVMKFTVAGKMKVEQSETLDVGPTSPLIEVTGNMLERKKKTPRPERFRGRRGDLKDTLSTPSSPSKESPFTIRRSFSEPVSDDSGEENRSGQNLKPIVSVPKIDDETFTSFFTGMSVEKCETESIEISESDFDVITPHSELLVHKRNIQMQRRRVTSKNPLKTLAARTDLKSEYTEIRTGVAEKVMRSLNVEKLAKNSPLAIEALAGLASTEDFSNITLRNASETSASTNKLRPYKDLMLILVKGRRHVQVRLVEPVFESINSGDNFVLVTKSDVYNYVGKFSNVIEKARAAEIALSIQQNKDLGCQASQVITIHEDKVTCTKSQLQKFWTYLGAETENVDVVDGGHPEEDELYESAIIDTNMAYEIKDEELVPMEKYWGGLPKIEMLDPSKVLVFDFGTEMYIWSGKGALSEEKKVATRLATELWNEGYNYGECAVCPITTASMIGRRKPLADVKSAKSRPKWCLFAKLTQHVETVLFREKFLDWPNMSGIIRVRNADKEKEQTDGTITVEPCNIDDMLKPNTTPVDFILEGSHLGRGTGWYDDELMKQYVVTTQNVTVWHIDEFSHTLLDERYIGHFYTGDSYIIRWMYSVTITGRELSGLPSKHAAKGRDRSAYFIWQGNNASLNEQGAAALLTVVLDQDQGPQIRVVEGHEPAAFFNLFAGKMVVHQGKRTDKDLDQRWRLYMCRGTLETEVSLTEIPCSARQLRSRGSLVLVDCKKDVIYVWHGCNTLPHIRKNALNAANNLKKTGFDEIGLSVTAEINEIDETKEPEEFFNGLGGSNKKLYVSLDKQPIQDHTPRLFHLSSVLKEFQSTELLCPLRATELPTPFPFLQDELYQVNQPALFLLDNKDEIWIWQGWWPDTGAEDQSGSKAVRWQAERRATMTVAMQYWQNTHPVTTKFPIYLVWAGLEPLQFINLFPTWTYRDDIAELNIQDGRNAGEVLTVESELARLTQSTYPPAQLLQRPLPEGVDPTHLELYLSQQHFEELLGMSREEFQELPVWKQVNIKKEIGLF